MLLSVRTFYIPFDTYSQAQKVLEEAGEVVNSAAAYEIVVEYNEEDYSSSRALEAEGYLFDELADVIISATNFAVMLADERGIDYGIDQLQAALDRKAELNEKRGYGAKG